MAGGVSQMRVVLIYGDFHLDVVIQVVLAVLVLRFFRRG
jgi:hypothetical protein